jgi:amino-acid N-acetyltransferase
MEKEIRYPRAAIRDERTIQSLLGENSLPQEGISGHIDHFILAKDSETTKGCIGLEVYGEIGFIRSLAVKTAFRN